MEVEHQQASHLSLRGPASEAHLGRSPLGVTVPDGCDLVDPSEWPEVQAALTSRG